MSRSGFVFVDYDDGCSDYPNLDQGRYVAARRKAFNGKRGQAFLRELRDTLEAMPEKRLIADDLIAPDGSVCAIGAVGRARGIDMTGIDPEDADKVGDTFNIAPTMAREIVFTNDDEFKSIKDETPEQRYIRMLEWTNALIVDQS